MPTACAWPCSGRSAKTDNNWLDASTGDTTSTSLENAILLARGNCVSRRPRASRTPKHSAQNTFDFDLIRSTAEPLALRENPPMAQRYNFREAEQKWQSVWDRDGTFSVTTDQDKPKYYVLEMFPYPSGRIHMGHLRCYTLGDVVARYKRSQGFNVLHPMGWDAFGLPAENAAMEKNVHPASWTYQNIATMRDQLRAMGLSIDWSREIATCDPDYYRHEQALFIDFLEKDLVYRQDGWVNWDPVDHTVLANEQVIDGKGWRSGAPIERRRLAQWFCRITNYSDELLEALGTLDRWPPKVRAMQENWIGRSEGAYINFAFTAKIGRSPSRLHDTPRHDLRCQFLRHRCGSPSGRRACQAQRRRPQHSSRNAGIGHQRGSDPDGRQTRLRHGLRVAHPFIPGRELPVFIANFVLMGYGTGAIFGCPAHDQRDLDFAHAYDLPVLPVVVPGGSRIASGFDRRDEAYTGPGALGKFQPSSTDWTSTLPSARSSDGWRTWDQGEGAVNYRLRDWLVSRQRYWGCPIPGDPL